MLNKFTETKVKIKDTLTVFQNEQCNNFAEMLPQARFFFPVTMCCNINITGQGEIEKDLFSR